MTPFLFWLGSLVEKFGEEAVRALLARGADHPSTPPEVQNEIRKIAARALPTEVDDARMKGST